MRKREPGARQTVKDLAAMRQRGETRSDWAKAAAMTSEAIETTVAADPDKAGIITDWDNATIGTPQPKAVLHMRVDQDVLDYFRETGRGYQPLINAVLKSYVSRMRHGQRQAFDDQTVSHSAVRMGVSHHALASDGPGSRRERPKLRAP